MPRQCTIFLILLAAMAGAISGQALSLDPTSGSLAVEATSAFSQPNPTTLGLTMTAPVYVAVYNVDGYAVSAGGQCMLPANSSLTLANINSVYVTVTVAAASVTVTAANTTFSAQVVGDDGYPVAQIQAAYAPTTVSVTNGTGPNCNTFAGYGLKGGEYWAITQNPPSGRIIQGLDGDSDGPPIPIVGNSLHLQSPNEFHCKGDGSSCYVDGLGQALRLMKQKHLVHSDIFIYLEEAAHWSITAYPQDIEISKGYFSSKVEFDALTPGRFHLQAGPRIGSAYSLDVVDASGNAKIVRPQQFVITWSMGILSKERSLTMSCAAGNCQLALVTKKQ